MTNLPGVAVRTLSGVVQRFLRRSQDGEHRSRRLTAIVQGSVTAIGNKLFALIVNFISVPLTIGYLGDERYGIWVTIGSLLAWLALTDFGLGNGFNTAIANAVGQERVDLVRQHIATAFLLLSSIAAVVAMLMFVAWPWIDWAGLFGAKSPIARAEIGPAIAVAIAIWLVQFPLSVTNRIWNAYQEGRIANYWGATGNAISLAMLFLVTRTEGGLVPLVVALSGTGLAINVASTVWLFRFKKRFLLPRLHDVSRASLSVLGRTGGAFFLLQVTYLLVFQTDNLVVGHFLGAAEVPKYSVTYNLFNYCLILQTMAFSYLWIAYGEAIARNDIAWVKRTLHITLIAGTCLTLVLALTMTTIARPFISWWAGPAVTPPMALVFWMAAWAVINAFTSPISCLLAAAAHLRNQTIYSTIACVMNVVLTIALVKQWGVTGAIAGTVLSYGVFICIPTFVDVELLLKRLERRTAATV